MKRAPSFGNGALFMPFARRQARKRRHVDECIRTGRRIPGRSCLQSAFRAERRKVASSPPFFPVTPVPSGNRYARRKRHRPAPPRQERTLLSEKVVPKSVLPGCENPRPRLQHHPLTKMRTGALSARGRTRQVRHSPLSYASLPQCPMRRALPSRNADFRHPHVHPVPGHARAIRKI